MNEPLIYRPAKDDLPITEGTTILVPRPGGTDYIEVLRLTRDVGGSWADGTDRQSQEPVRVWVADPAGYRYGSHPRRVDRPVVRARTPHTPVLSGTPGPAG